MEVDKQPNIQEDLNQQQEQIIPVVPASPITSTSNAEDNEQVLSISSDMNRISLGNNIDITEDNVNDIIDTMKEAIQQIPSTTQIGLKAYEELLQQFANATKSLSLEKNIALVGVLSKMSTSIEQQRQILLPTIKIVEMQMEQQPPQDQQAVIFRHLHQYVQELHNLDLQRRIRPLIGKSKDQVLNFNRQGLIDRVVRTNNPKLPLNRIFVNDFKVRQDLTWDQCDYLLQRINATPALGDNGKALPFFNPDFHFNWTILQFDHDVLVWDKFTDVHKISQVNLDENKGLPLLKIEAKFAFNQNCRWIRIAFDPSWNILLNERQMFIIANDRGIKRNDQKPCARVFIPRCAHTGATDGQYAYFFISDQTVFMDVYYRLCNISPILRNKEFKVEIIAPQAKSIKHKELPLTMPDLPHPFDYELQVAIGSSWCSLVKTQLVDSLQQRFSPVLGFGSVYIPQYSDLEYAVSGTNIKNMVAFRTSSHSIDSNKYYNWDIATGTWVENNSRIQDMKGYSEYVQYMEDSAYSLEQQLSVHEAGKAYATQKCDYYTGYTYGSNHFWTMYNRAQPQNQVIRSPKTILGEHSSGLDPLRPNAKDDELIYRLLLGKLSHNDNNKDIILRQYIDKECVQIAEIAIRYRRFQHIVGFRDPQLQWTKPQGSLMPSRIPHLLEFISVQMTQHQIDYYRATNVVSNMYLIPKPIMEHLEFGNDTYFKTKRSSFQTKSIWPQNVGNSQNQSTFKQVPFKGKNKRPNAQNEFSRHKFQKRQTLFQPQLKKAIISPQECGFQDVSVRRNSVEPTFKQVTTLTFSTVISQKICPTKPLQILVQDTSMLCQEWNLADFLGTDSSVMISAMRNHQYKTNSGQLLLHVLRREDYYGIVEKLLTVSLFGVYLIYSKHIPFPLQYSYMPLRYSAGMERVPSSSIDTNMDDRFFEYPLQQPEYRLFLVPGPVLSLSAYQTFYSYDPITDKFVQQKNTNLKSFSSSAARNYRALLTKKVNIFLGAFPQIQDIQMPVVQKNRAKKIKCIQESRLFLLDNKFLGHQAKHEMMHTPNQ